jgi:5-methylcytosine-specific restriction endonuclease McrA
MREFEVDHVRPIAKGGRHSEDNLQLTHRRCNRKKGAR